MEIDVLFLGHFWVPIRQSILKITLGMTLCENILANLSLRENLFFVQFLNCSTQIKIVFCFLFCPVRHFTFVRCLPIKMSSWTQPHFFFRQSCCDRNLRGLCNTKILGWKVALMIVFHLFLRQHFYYIFRRIKILYDLTSSSKNFLFVY